MSAGSPADARRPHRFAERNPAPLAVAAITALLCFTAVGSANAALAITAFTASTASNQAGAHSDATARFAFKTTLDTKEGPIPVGGTLRDLTIKLPPGLVAAAKNVPRCAVASFRSQECPAATQIGAGNVTIGHIVATNEEPTSLAVQVYDLATSPAQPVAIGIQLGQFNPYGQEIVTATTHASDNYAVTLSAPETPRPFGAVVLGGAITIWGVPADPSHDPLRACNGSHDSQFGCPSEAARLPFVENPTDCSQAPLTTLSANTNEEPEVFTTATFTAPNPTDCRSVPFAPAVLVNPETTRTGAPSGVELALSVPQSVSANGQGSSELKSAVVTLPAGMVISPSAASDGLEGCTDEQFGAGSDQPATCPVASQIGTSEVITPLLSGALTGKLYLGTPLSDDPMSGQMFRIFLELKGFGQDVKLAGSVLADPQTGQLTAIFANLPELPFSEARIRLDGGATATLTNPTTCGSHTATTRLYPYSEPGTPATPSSSFTTSQDGAGAPCASPPFTPSASLAEPSSQAGAASPLTVSFSRPDGSQPLGQISAHLPAGLLGNVSAVTLCDAPDADAGTCSASSRIGVLTATAGAGPAPLTVHGSVYLARGENGYPFMLSVVVPAIAGPYDLGNVVVPVWLQVNNDASLTAVTGPLPSILDGVPLDIRSVTMTIDRPAFTFNPTSCNTLAMNATATSLSGALSAVSTPFQAVGCRGLPFAPSFTTATQGSVSKANGASLTVQVAQRPGEANIRSVRVELPKQLPSRLTTLQHACTEAQFTSNPAGCPAQSDVGTATAYTPVLSSPLRGPAFLVSHGASAFPDLEVVLQGEGVTVILDGQTDIKKGVTSSTFASLPDVPVSGFQLTLPQGPYSLLGANGVPCASKLAMPTRIVSQSGVTVSQNTRIAVTGCARARSTVKILRERTHGATLSLIVKVSAAGTLSGEGHGLSRASIQTPRGGRVALNLRLSDPLRQSLARHRHVTVPLRVTLAPHKGAPAVRRTTLTFA